MKLQLLRELSERSTEKVNEGFSPSTGAAKRVAAALTKALPSSVWSMVDGEQMDSPASYYVVVDIEGDDKKTAKIAIGPFDKKTGNPVDKEYLEPAKVVSVSLVSSSGKMAKLKSGEVSVNDAIKDVTAFIKTTFGQ